MLHVRFVVLYKIRIKDPFRVVNVNTRVSSGWGGKMWNHVMKEIERERAIHSTRVDI